MIKYITAPIYYINGTPHLGHLYTSVAVDILARFEIMMGREAYASFGTDEHGQKVEASANNEPVQEYADRMSQKFRDLINAANIDGDWVRTTAPDHKDTAIWLWNEIQPYLYDHKYSGWYAKSDEAYYKDEEIADGVAIATGSKVEWIEEECIFFRLSAFKQQLLDYYSANSNAIMPESKYNEVLGLLKQDPPDFAVSRTRFTWGIQVPDRENHVMYVWLDALSNYLTFLKRRDLPYDNIAQMVHIIGKDILKFHAIYWPAFLLAANLPLPKQIFAHGWLLVKDDKMSKSKGNALDPFEMLEKYGVDEMRYALCRIINFGNDGNFSEDDIPHIINTELVNEVGNLVQRVLVLCHSRFGEIPPCDAFDSPILRHWDDAATIANEAISRQSISEYVNAVRNAVIATNQYMSTVAPWSLPDPKKELGILCACVKRMAIILSPAMPEKCAFIAAMVGIKPSFAYWSHSESHMITKPQPLFTRH